MACGFCFGEFLGIDVGYFGFDAGLVVLDLGIELMVITGRAQR